MCQVGRKNERGDRGEEMPGRQKYVSECHAAE